MCLAGRKTLFTHLVRNCSPVQCNCLVTICIRQQQQQQSRKCRQTERMQQRATLIARVDGWYYRIIGWRISHVVTTAGRTDVIIAVGLVHYKCRILISWTDQCRVSLHTALSYFWRTVITHVVYRIRHGTILHIVHDITNRVLESRPAWSAAPARHQKQIDFDAQSASTWIPSPPHRLLRRTLTTPDLASGIGYWLFPVSFIKIGSRDIVVIISDLTNGTTIQSKT